MTTEFSETPILTWQQWHNEKPRTADTPAELWAEVGSLLDDVGPEHIHLANVVGLGAKWIVAAFRMTGPHRAVGLLWTERWLMRIQPPTIDLGTAPGFRAELVRDSGPVQAGAIPPEATAVTVVGPRWHERRFRDCARSWAEPDETAPAVVLGRNSQGQPVAYPARQPAGVGWAPSGAVIRINEPQCRSLADVHEVPLHDGPESMWG